MTRRTGAIDQNRNLDEEIRRKNENTRIDALRKTYGQSFARGYKGSDKLLTLLDDSGVRSLTEYLKRK